jgi:SAM-dependent methyltransferase
MWWQVESFLLVLRPVLEAAGHKPAAVVAAAAAAAAAQRNSGVQQPCNSCTHASASIGLQQAGWDHTPQQQPAQHQQDEPPATPAVHHASQQPGHQLAPPLSLHIVDFGCGSGNLLLPIAALLPQCRFTGVDMKPAALGLLMQRASAAGLSNVSVFTGMIEQYNEPFDVALALHACGNATDHVLQVRAAHSQEPRAGAWSCRGSRSQLAQRLLYHHCSTAGVFAASLS